MKTRIALLGTGLLLTIGTAVAGSLLYGQGQSAATSSYEPVAAPVAQQVTPEMIAMWKVTAASSDYVAPRIPI